MCRVSITRKEVRQMKQNNSEKRTLREEWRLTARGIKIWNELMPGYWLSQAFRFLAETFSPYFGIYMSARLVDELAGGGSTGRLLTLAAVTVCGGCLLSVLTRMLQEQGRLRGSI